MFDDPRWSNVRLQLMQEAFLGSRKVTFLFGIMITMVCPFMYIVQTFLFGITANILFIARGKLCEVLKQVTKRMKHQTVILLDGSAFLLEPFKKEECYTKALVIVWFDMQRLYPVLRS